MRAKRWWASLSETPYLAVRLEDVERSYREFRRALPEARVYYAMKANPTPPVMWLLAQLGSSFDVASGGELISCLELGIHPSRISFGNTAKRTADIQLAYASGVRHFTADSQQEVEKLAVLAPGCYVTIRMLVDCEGADWPLSRKFGCDGEMAAQLLGKAKRFGLQPFGLSFHVGSQQSNPNAWDGPIQAAAEIFTLAAKQGIDLEALNIGGGFPATYVKDIPVLEAYGHAIRSSIQRWFPGGPPKVMAEPGRGLVGDAGVLVSEVILVSRKSASDEHRWVTLDCGLFGGLVETLGEAIRYRIETDRDSDAVGPTIIAGPTCDSQDILYERTPYPLPLTLRCGDQVRLLSAGAYTFPCGGSFNGFSPLQCICV